MGRNTQEPKVIENCASRQSSGQDGCDGKPGSVFDRSALEAVQRFKYKPKVKDGKTVRSTGILHKISYELE